MKVTTDRVVRLLHRLQTNVSNHFRRDAPLALETLCRSRFSAAFMIWILMSEIARRLLGGPLSRMRIWLVGFTRKPIDVAAGTRSRSRPSCLPTSSSGSTPVMVPARSFKLVTRPFSTRIVSGKEEIGVFVVGRFGHRRRRGIRRSRPPDDVRGPAAIRGADRTALRPNGIRFVRWRSK